MSLTVKRILSAVMALVFVLALASCSAINVNKSNPKILKVGNKWYKFEDYSTIFNDKLYTYAYGGGEAAYNPDFANQTSLQRLTKYQDYAYDMLIEQAIKDYLVEKNGLADKLTEEDKTAIYEEVDKQIQEKKDGYAEETSTEDVKLEQLKKQYTLTDEEVKTWKDAAKKTVDEAIAEAAKNVETEPETDDTESDATVSDATTSDATESDATESAETAEEADDATTSDKAIEAILEEKGMETYDEYVKSVEEEAELNAYLEKYKADQGEIKYKDFLKEEKKTADEYRDELFEAQKVIYLRDTKLKDSLGVDFKVEDKDIKAEYDKKVEEVKKQYEETPYDFYTAMQNKTEDTTIWVTPDGYFYVKHILLMNDKDLTPSEETESGDTELKAYVAQETIDEVEAGIAEIKTKKAADAEFDEFAAFDKLITKYNEDPGMEQEPAKTEGYMDGVNLTQSGSEDSVYYAPFHDAAVKLYKNGKVGDISDAVVSESGIHYIQLVKKVEPSTVKFEDVKADLEEKLTTDGINKLMTEKLDATKKDVKVAEFRDRIRSCGYGYESYYFSSQS